MTDSKMLSDEITDSGMTITAIAKKIGITREGFYKKLNNETEFKASEISALQKILRLTNKKRDEIKHQKQAGHDGNIVVGQNGKPKGHAVEHSLLFPHKTLQSVNDQREEENAVQPHDIPAVRRHISGQRIKNPEKSDTQNTVFTVLF